MAWHPLTYGVLQRIRRTREMVCDDIAAQAMQSEIGYAKCLLAMAGRTLRQHDLADAAQAIGLFGDNVLEERIMRLMQQKTTMTMQAKLVRIASGAIAMILAIAIAASFHVTPTLAQTSGTAVTAPAPPAPPTPLHRTWQLRPAASSACYRSFGYARATASALARCRAGTRCSACSRRTRCVRQPDPGILRWLPRCSRSLLLSPFHLWLLRRRKRSRLPNTRKPFIPIRQKAKDESFMIDSNGEHAMTPEQRAQFQKDMAAMDAQIAEATKRFNSPEFKQQMADIAKQQANMKHLDFAQMQRQIDAATAKINSPEFKQQMADIQKQIESGAMQRSMEEASKQMKLAEQQQSAIQKVDMARMQQQIAAATAKINSPEFKQKMADIQKQIESGAMQRSMEEASKRLKAEEDRMRQQQTK